MIKCTKTLGLLIFFLLIDLVILIISWNAVASGGFAGATTLGVLSTFLFVLLAVVLISKLYSYSQTVEIDLSMQEGAQPRIELANKNFRHLQGDVVINIVPNPEYYRSTDTTVVDLNNPGTLKK